jgi:predicted nucleic acid-binding protein
VKSSVWVDANVLLRLITGDPQEMADKVAGIVARAERGELVLRVTPIVVAETVWVLLSFYVHSKRQVADTLIALLLADGVRAEERDLVVAALDDMAAANVDFADAHLARVARARGEAVCSFDSDFKRLSVSLVMPGDD